MKCICECDRREDEQWVLIGILVALRWSLLGIFDVPTVSGWRWSSTSVFFARATARAVITYFCVIMLLIDSAWQELSNGGQFVKFDHSNTNGEILAVKSDLAELCGKSTRFWPRRLSKSRTINIIILLIDTARRQLSKTPLIVLIGRLGDKISIISIGPLSVGHWVSFELVFSKKWWVVPLSLCKSSIIWRFKGWRNQYKLVPEIATSIYHKHNFSSSVEIYYKILCRKHSHFFDHGESQHIIV